MTAANIEDWGTRAFGAVASFRGPHWEVDKSEIAPFSADAAKVANDVLDKMDEGTAKKVAALSAGVSVAVGIGLLVVPRAYVDIQLAKQRNIARTAAYQSELPDVNEYHPAEETRTPPASVQGVRPSGENEPVSVHPRETILGLNVDRGGLT